MTDFLRELAIRIMSQAVICETERFLRSKERAQRLQEIMRRLIAGRSSRQVEKMERAQRLRI